MRDNLYIVLMAGGSGTRFWPYSRKKKPKQFLDILGVGKTLIQSAYERFLPLCPSSNIFVVTTEELIGPVKDQLPLSDDQILAEPMGKNTLPCIAYACYKIAKKCAEASVVISPSDHLILNEVEFQKAITESVNNAVTTNNFITMGIKPTRPEIGYGYIQYIHSDSPFKKVKTFVEKPSRQKAEEFIKEGNFVWNSGIFTWNVQAFLSALKKYSPHLNEAFKEIYPDISTPRESAAIRHVYPQLEPLSVDYGIMEKANNIYVWLSHFGWSDLGSWNSLYNYQQKDVHGNVVNANAVLYDTHNSIIKGSRRKLIVTQGLQDYLIGEFEDVFIVCPKHREQFFRQIVADLKDNPEHHIYL